MILDDYLIERCSIHTPAVHDITLQFFYSFSPGFRPSRTPARSRSRAHPGYHPPKVVVVRIPAVTRPKSLSCASRLSPARSRCRAHPGCHPPEVVVVRIPAVTRPKSSCASRLSPARSLSPACSGATKTVILNSTSTAGLAVGENVMSKRQSNRLDTYRRGWSSCCDPSRH
ncbi:hypothetical protein LSAT2_020941 [Lamellibrachia satsuma]|nr:hypothetical protein LSAT2_020941 [Lamellibrachia satsuma]